MLPLDLRLGKVSQWGFAGWPVLISGFLRCLFLTDAYAYDECIRIRQEESHGAMRAFCSDVRPSFTLLRLCSILSNLINCFSHGPTTELALHLRHDDPRYQRPAQ